MSIAKNKYKKYAHFTFYNVSLGYFDDAYIHGWILQICHGWFHSFYTL